MNRPADHPIVMVVDDEPGVALYCQAALERAGYEVISVLDPRQARGILQQARIDCLLVDIRMPQMDGFRVLELAREYQPNCAVVIMTGFGTLETATRALSLGANALILKPFNGTQELLESVQHALEDRDHEREVSRLQTLRPLLELSRKLFGETDPNSLVELLMDSVCTYVNCEHAGFYQHEIDPDGVELLALRAQRGSPLPSEKPGFSGGPIALADAWASPLRINRADTEDAQLADLIAAHRLEAVLCAPARRGGQGRSVLLAGRGEGSPPFSDADMELFSLLTRQAALALENARLYADLRSSLERLRESQRALIQSEKMAAIGRLAASIAHEVNNPLQAVRNCLHLVGRIDLDQEKRTVYLDLAGDELERLMTTIQLMLDFYRPSARNTEAILINQLIENTLKLLKKQLDEANITVATRFAPDIPPIEAVRNQIQQVFFNLLLNAIQAIGFDGQIQIDTTLTGECIELIIQDSGSGVTAEHRENIFEPFMSTKPDGTGLGLSVSYSIVDAHGGQLSLLDNDPRCQLTGACFRIRLPIRESK